MLGLHPTTHEITTRAETKNRMLHRLSQPRPPPPLCPFKGGRPSLLS